jgi:hypothetical protein
MERRFVAVPALLVACAVNVPVPAVVGDPVIAPVEEFSDSPAGRLPLARVQVIGVVPVAVSVCE